MAARWWGWTFDDDGVKVRKVKLKEGFSPLDKLDSMGGWGYGTRGERVLDREANNYGTVMIKWYKGVKKMFDEWW